MSNQRMNQILSRILKEMAYLDDIFLELNNEVKLNICVDKKTPIEDSMNAIRKDAKSVTNAIRHVISQRSCDKD